MNRFVALNGVKRIPGFGQAGLREVHAEAERMRMAALERKYGRKLLTEAEKTERRRYYNSRRPGRGKNIL